jgi:ABC-2 type transport system permease protein
MGLVESARKLSVVTGLTQRYLLGSRRVIPMALLSAIPLILVASLVAARSSEFNILVFQTLMSPLLLQVVLIFVTLVCATTLIREEIDDNTIPYLLTRPISRSAVVLYKYLGYLAAVLILLVPPIVLAYGVTEAYQGTGFGANLDVLGGFLVATVVGSAAYGALFLFVSVLVRKPLALGLLIGFVWESIVGSIPGDVPKLSVIHYLRSILKGMIAVGPMTTYPSDMSVSVAILIPVGFTIAMIVLSLMIFQQMEFRQKA